MRIPKVAAVTAVAIAAILSLTAQTAQASVTEVRPTAPPPTASARAEARAGTDNPTCYYGDCYDYVFGQQNTPVTGASANMYVADPVVNHAYGDEHSLQELSVQNSDQTSTVEIGWTVDPSVNGDYVPHLFVYHWVNGQTSCYNGCGFVQVSSTVTAGQKLPVGSTAAFAIDLVQGDWWVYYDNEAVGYFPGSLWNGGYTQGDITSAFGEIALDTADVPSCTQMGDGTLGSSAGSSWISGYQIQGASTAPALAVSATSPDYYDAGSVTPTSFHLGGPGTGGC